MRTALRVAAALAAAATLVLIGAAPAWAHAYIVSSSPAAGSTVGTLDRVSITFDEDLLDLGRNAIEVRGPGGTRIETACARVDGPTMSVPVRFGGPGGYRVVWRASSADGHLVGGSYAFRYDGTAASAAGPGPAPSCAPIGPAAAPRTPPVSTVLIVAIAVSVAALVAVLAVVVITVIAVRRADRDTPRPDGKESPP